MNRESTDRHAERAEANADVGTIESMLAANRAALDRTLSELEQRVSMDGFFQQAMERLRSENGAEFLRNLRDSVVHNPLPITLAAIGLAWTAFSDNSGRSGSAGMGLGDVREKAAGAAQRLGAAKARGREWAGRGGEAMSSARERAGELGQNAAESTRRSIEQTRDFALEYPIITAGAGLMLGAALAALLPATQFENERVGPARDRAMRAAREATAATVKGAKEGAKEEISGGDNSGAKETRGPQAEAGLFPGGPGSDGSGGNGSPRVRTT